MASNGKPQFFRQVFSQQSNGAAGNAGNASVVQDKTALTRGRAASAQPEPRKKPARLRETINNPQRVKNTAAASARPSILSSG